MPVVSELDEKFSNCSTPSNYDKESLDYELSVVEGEKAVLNMWKEENIPEKVHRATVGKKPFNVYDGPPFATGTPHYGHILISFLKDCVMRYKRQTGHSVDPRFGWDCHGLPIEFEIDKKLGIKTPGDVEKIGIKAYNDECRSIVSRFSNEWEEIIQRIGRWADFKDDFKTMYPKYMESVWAIFKMIFDKGLVYKGFKVMPFSIGCTTPLSNFEANSNYKDVDDPSIIVTFPMKDNENVKFLAWTTTPWTLPSNLAICVHPEMIYVKVKSLMENDPNSEYIFLKSRIPFIKKIMKKFEVLEEVKGSDLAGIKYIPLFNFYENLQARTAAFTVLSDNYVTDSAGTGVVQQAPYFGVDDYRVTLEHGLISKNECVAMPINEVGCFTSDVPPYQNMFIKDADKEIIKDLKASKRLFNLSSEKHSYPFCWRSNTPLIYRAISSWFINVEMIVDNLVKANQDVNWVPSSIKDGRFGKWLENAQDWLVSRNRYWGCPIPIWVSDDMEEIVCIGSVAELKELTGITVTDLHRHNIDHITIESKFGKGPLKRIPEVFDCWFESGCVPYASNHYPFEKKETFNNIFPAEFISEGIDQCRGWFYTLIVISTALFGKAPYQNVVTLGLIMAEDGQKMSKSKKNFPDPMLLIDKFGADSLRMYLMSSPSVHGESINFRQQDVEEFLKKVVIQIYNSAKFLKTSIEMRNMSCSGEKYFFDLESFEPSNDIIDKWIISLTNSLVKSFHTEMDKFYLYKVIPKIPEFMNNLNNWFIRLNRARLKGQEISPDQIKSQKYAIDTLFYILLKIVSLFAPFLPFMTERIYQTLTPYLKSKTLTKSVHMTELPQCNPDFINQEIESTVDDIQNIINLIRSARDKAKVPIKNPLSHATVFCQTKPNFMCIPKMLDLISYDTNVKTINLVDGVENNQYGIYLIPTANYRQLAGRLKKDSKKVLSSLSEVPQSDLFKYKSGQSIEICGHEIMSGDLCLQYATKSVLPNIEFQYNEKFLLLLNTEVDEELKNEAAKRYLISNIQQARKSLKLNVSDHAEIMCMPLTPLCKELINNFKEEIEKVVNGKLTVKEISTSQSKSSDVFTFELDSELLLKYTISVFDK